MRKLILIVLLGMAGRGLAGQQQSRPTVAEMLTANGVPDALVRTSERALHPESFDARQEGSIRLFAWISEIGDEDLLTVARYDTLTNQIRRINLKNGSAGIEDNPASQARYKNTAISTQVWGICVHDVGFSERTTGWITLTTHVNPSFGCTLLFDDKLQFHFLINGWLNDVVGDWLVIEQSMIHFAPTHPESLDVFNPRSGELERIYPHTDDPARTAYQAKLRKYMASEKECVEKNLSCDVESMDASIDSTHRVGPTSFTFTVTLSPAGMGERAEKEVPEQATRYQASWVDGRWQVRGSTP